VDFVIGHGDRLLPMEVKATTQPGTNDLKGLRAFMDEYADRVSGALLLHGGTQVFWIARNVLAAPWWMVV
jgi:hypothetical protein